MRLWRFDMPFVVGVLVVATFVLSLAGVILARLGVPLVRYGVLVPSEVFRGQLWRLVTWQFFQLEPISLIFSVAMLYWFGPDLSRAWGPRRFLAVYFSFTAIIGVVMCLVGRFLWPELYEAPIFGAWPIVTALTIAWASLFPDREIFLFFVLRANGNVLIALTIGMTALFAAFNGLAAMLPEFLGEAMMLIYVGQVRRWWLKGRLTRLQKQKKKYVDNVIRLDREEDKRRDPPDKPRYLN